MTTDPSAETSFFGREAVLSILAKRLEAFQNGFRQNIGILGPPAIGKTSLLQEFFRRIPYSDILIVPFSCRESESFEHFAQRWMSEILFSFYRSSGKPIPTDFQSTLRSSIDVIPKTLRLMKSVKKLSQISRYSQAYRELLNLSEVLYKECGKKVLFFLDDFDRLGDLPVDDPFSLLGSEIMIQKQTMYVVASSRLHEGRNILSEKMSLLFGNFEVIPLGSFGFEEARAFLENRFPDCCLSDQRVRYLLWLSDGRPFYLSCLTKERCLCPSANGRGIRDGLVAALVNELFRKDGSLHQFFKETLAGVARGRSRAFYGDVLYALALGHKKVTQISRFLHRKGNDVANVLERLLQAEVIERHGSMHVVSDVLFRFWLEKVYYRNRFLSERAPQAGEASFTEDVRQSLQAWVNTDGLDLPKRIEELFRKFHNDVLVYEGRRFKCPHFSEISSRPSNGRMFPVLAQNGQTRWLCQILSNTVTEDDVRTYLQDLKRLRNPVHKRMIVGIGGIDLNAKLLAKEAKIQYLDLRHLNFLMNVYDQPKFVL